MLLVCLFKYVFLVACGAMTGMFLSDDFEAAVEEDPDAMSTTLGPKATAQVEKAGGTLMAMQVVSSFAGLFYFIVLFKMRAKIRERFQLPGNSCTDCFVSLCCGFCSIAQMATHVKSYKSG